MRGNYSQLSIKLHLETFLKGQSASNHGLKALPGCLDNKRLEQFSQQILLNPLKFAFVRLRLDRGDGMPSQAAFGTLSSRRAPGIEIQAPLFASRALTPNVPLFVYINCSFVLINNELAHLFLVPLIYPARCNDCGAVRHRDNSQELGTGRDVQNHNLTPLRVD